MAAPSRLVYVDDTSPLISYQGPWARGDTYSSITPWGPPFNNTLHALIGSGIFTFNFTGPSVVVRGKFQTYTSAASLPSWTCYLDGNALISTPNVVTLGNVTYAPFCLLKDIVPKATPSNLTVVASGTADYPFLFDYIEYEPDATSILDNATVIVPALDDQSQIEYSSGWSMVDGVVMETSVPGSSLSFDFVGIQITWMTTAFYNSNITANASAQYSIDNGTLFPFQVAAKSSTIQNFNLVSFKSPILSPGSHHLFVKYGVDNLNGSAPLFLDYFIIQNQTIPSVTQSTSTSTQIPTVTQGPTIAPNFYHAGSSEGEIAGVVIGSLVGLALIIFGLIWFIKGKNIRKHRSDRSLPPKVPGRSDRHIFGHRPS